MTKDDLTTPFLSKLRSKCSSRCGISSPFAQLECHHTSTNQRSSFCILVPELFRNRTRTTQTAPLDMKGYIALPLNFPIFTVKLPPCGFFSVSQQNPDQYNKIPRLVYKNNIVLQQIIATLSKKLHFFVKKRIYRKLLYNKTHLQFSTKFKTVTTKNYFFNHLKYV